MIDSFQTIAKPASARITRKKSRFLAFLIPVGSLDEVEAELRRLRKTHHDANHVCFAYRLHSEPTPLSAAEDAGEPSGSAGLPILQQLQRAELLDLLAVVIRHFGGVKLGVGGLVRAYSDAVSAALTSARVIERAVTVEIEITFPPELTSPVMSIIHRLGATVARIEYDAQARAALALAPSRAQEFIRALRDATGGRASTEVKA
jgi:uncharacterized YigZ family protein